MGDASDFDAARETFLPASVEHAPRRWLTVYMSHALENGPERAGAWVWRWNAAMYERNGWVRGA